MKTPTVLLLGGKNKGYDYAPLFVALKNSKVTHIVLYGENRYELLKSARANDFENISVCADFEFAVRVASIKATAGETVLLSPASASFDAFANYEERGDKFVEIVNALKTATQPSSDEKSNSNNQENTECELVFSEDNE